MPQDGRRELRDEQRKREQAELRLHSALFAANQKLAAALAEGIEQKSCADHFREACEKERKKTIEAMATAEKQMLW